MATPTTNSVTYTYVGAVGPGGGIMSGYKWGGALGTGVTVSFSFPGLPTAYSETGYGQGEFNNWSYLSNTERAVVRSALQLWSSYANIKFVEYVDNATTVGELRFGYWNNAGPNEAGHAYYPGSDPEAGDVWFNPSIFNLDRAAVPLGSYDWATAMHEIGHAIGLEHPFEGQTRLLAPRDNYLYTIMSYTASPWSNPNDNYASFYPTTPMYYDLLAIQTMYGKNTTVNRGNNIYNFVDGNRYWQAINDAGGTDTMVYSGVEASILDLRPGQFSAVSETIFFTSASTRKTVTIGPGVVIENARGGSGSDSLIGNPSANLLRGEIGNDTLVGYAGNDTFLGGPGNDRHFLGTGFDTIIFSNVLNGATNVDRIMDYNPAQDTMKLENAIFKLLVNTGTLLPGLFRKGLKALDSNDRVIYNPNTGDLIYDTNGIPFGAEIKFAKLATGLSITNADFFVI